MKRTYKTAQGQIIDLDALRLANEDAIAVGNMHVNARGDQLGPGGEVVKPRNQAMDEYYHVQADPIETIMHHQNQGVTIEDSVAPQKPKAKKATNKTKKVEAVVPEEPVVAVTEAVEVTVAEEAVAVTEEVPTSTKPLRGNLADSVAKEAQVNQTLLKPLNKRNGIQRI